MNEKAQAGGDWHLPYAPHLGYVPPFETMFAHSAGGDGMEQHFLFIASRGFAGVLHPWITSHPPENRTRYASLLQEYGLRAGCVLYAGLDQLLQPAWVSDSANVRDDLLRQVAEASDIAVAVGSRIIAVLVPADPGSEREEQSANLERNLGLAAAIAADKGVILGIEPMIDLPGMFFESTLEGADLLRRVNHPAVRLIFDTGHVATMDGDVLAVEEKVSDLVCLYQLADSPGRVEPGAGTIDFVALLSRIDAAGYDGLIELEHGWAQDGEEGERAGLDRLRSIDARVRSIAEGETV